MKNIFTLILIFLSFQFIYSQQTKYINADNLNVRSGPSKNHNVIETIPFGQKVTVLSVINGWSEIETEDGLKGYVFTSYLSDLNPISSTSKKESNSIWKVLLIIIGFYFLYKIFTNKNSSSSSRRLSDYSTNKTIKPSYSERKPEQSSVNGSKSEKFHCKFCGSEKDNLFFLTSAKCSKSPSGYHMPYEGNIEKKYLCKFCGSEKENLFFLTSGKCSKSSNGFHQPFEGGFRKSYSCKFCGSKKDNLFFLTSGKCNKSSNGYHQPLI